MSARYPLTPIQQGMLLHRLASPEAGFDIEQMVATIREALDPTRFRAAWEQLIARHAAFRTSFQWEGLPEPQQQVHEQVTVPWFQQDWSGLDSEERADRLAEFLREDRRQGFDPAAPPLVRFALFRIAQSEWQLVWTFHHMLADGQSYPALIREAFENYESLQSGREVQRPEPPAFQDFIEWQRQHIARNAEAAESYWREQLKGFSAAIPLPAAETAAEGFGERSLALDGTGAIHQFSRDHQIPMHVLVQAAWGLVLGRNSGEEDVIFGVTRACRKNTIPNSDSVTGLFINTVPVRFKLSPDATVLAYLQECVRRHRSIREFEHTPLVDIQKCSEVPAGSPLFETLVVFTPRLVGEALREAGGAWLHREVVFHERTNYPVTLFAYQEAELLLKLSYDRARFSDAMARRWLRQLETVLDALVSGGEQTLTEVPVLGAAEAKRLLVDWNETSVAGIPNETIHHLIEQQAQRTPDATAIVFQDQSLTYRELDTRSSQLAAKLAALGAGPEKLIGVCVERSLEMMIGLLAVLKSGAAYVPLDPKYPKERLGWVLEDTHASIVLTQKSLLASLPLHPCEIVLLDDPQLWDSHPAQSAPAAAGSRNLAYVLFTSGSSGRPKGVMIEHRNVINFFAGMDRTLDHRTGGTWLAVTSISFDISVLELFWTLSRGFKVVIQSEEDQAPVACASKTARPINFSLFYFAANAGPAEPDQYRLLLEGAKFADQHGFEAVWTPERHFHQFGGLYPNPALTSAAVAAVTSHIQIRAGSVVLPLHNPIRVAEEWAVVDNLSGGRVGLSFASGWHANDFALAPGNWAERKQRMFEGIETVRKLWRGEKVACTNGNGEPIEVKIFPQPVQSNPAIWVTAAGNIETFRSAGSMGANLLTNLLGQKIEDLAGKIQAYREARRAANHDGEGHVTLMLHTFVGADTEQVREQVRKPFTDYLKTSTELVKQARWEFPAFAQPGKNRITPVENDQLNEAEIDALMSHAFDRYFETSGLFGSPDRCLEMVDRLKAIGVDEIACLMDFGVDTEVVLHSLEYLDQVRERANAVVETAADYSIPAQLRRHAVTHLQCTPSRARILVADAASAASLRPLEKMLVGGEALPPGLAAQLTSAIDGGLVNMYGPTETTVWSTTAAIGENTEVTIGTPIVNTQIYIVDRHLRPAPMGASGELLIGGDGVGRGYLHREQLTAEKFIPNPFGPGRLYRTGDLARYREDGRIEFLRRLDSQVKIRGYRIELGDIEAALEEHPAVWECAVTAREDAGGDPQLVAYVVPQPAARESSADLVQHWGALWDETYSAAESPADPTLNTAGWISSYTGEAIPEDDMREWVDRTVARIVELKPRRVLEIGCGTGMLLFRVAPHCEHYQGVDLSEAALAAIRRQAGQMGLRNLTLRQAAADGLSDVEPASFDLVVINSVIQYFPGAEYLVDVLKQAAAAVKPGGAIFAGDVRDYSMLEAFHRSVETARAPASLDASELERRIQDSMRRENELLVAPGFFNALSQHVPRIAQAEIRKKGEGSGNEMTRFRYDAILSIADAPAIAVARPAPAWDEFVNRRSSEPSAAGALARELRNHLKERRPDYMVPSAVVILEALPRTPNGKVDWKALPAPTRTRAESKPAAPPRTETEKIIAEVWKELLNLDSIGSQDNFFDLGANSLTMVQASSRLRQQLNQPISLVSLFQFPTVSALAAHLAKAAEPEAEATPTRNRARLDTMLRRMHARQVAAEEIGA